jgi:hypothetical protein
MKAALLARVDKHKEEEQEVIDEDEDLRLLKSMSRKDSAEQKRLRRE